MNRKKLHLPTAIILVAIFIASCSYPAASPTPAVDAIATAALQQVYLMLTQTALAAPPTSTPIPTATFPAPTETPAPAAAEPTSSEPLKRPVVTAFTGCWTGPGEQYTLISNIAEKKYVEIIGMGNVPGWYVIRNPYFRNPCWIEAIYLKLDPRLDTSKFPMMTPMP
jgi:hypothetical protein